MCINNFDTSTNDSGSHWSLLFLDKLNSKAYHLDSLRPSNSSSAYLVASNLGIDKRGVHEVICIQQKQSFECGVHVLANAKYIAYHYCVNNTLSGCPFTEWFEGRIKCNHTSTSLQNIQQAPKHNFQEMTTTSGMPKVHKQNKWHNIPKKRKNKSSKCKHTASTGIITRNRFEVLDKAPEGSYRTPLSNSYSSQVFATKQNPPAQSQNVKNKNLRKTPVNYPTEINKEEKCKILIGSDSQGRDLSSYLDQESNAKFNILNNCHPGAPLQHIMQSITNCSDLTSFSRNDCVILMGGTNNVTRNTTANPKQFLSSIEEFLNRQLQSYRHTNLILSTIPYRYDLRAESPENHLIKEVNVVIRQMTYENLQVDLLDLYTLERHHHTKHGLHINRQGKRFISKKITKLIEKLVVNCNPITSISNPPSLSLSRDDGSVSEVLHSHSKANCKPLPDQSSTNTIQVIDGDMLDAVKHFRNHPNIAFSHCISADFHDRRHMSGGVAVVFRTEFGRPNFTDLVSSNLTLQNEEHGAAVYGLVTKKSYNSKPSEDDYNQAFEELTTELKLKKYEKLMCPPMGCMRDQISPQLFSRNIVQLHRSTGVSVDIIVRDERATRTLRNGLKHNEFVALLRSRIYYELSLGDKQCSPARTASTGDRRVLHYTSERDDVPVTDSGHGVVVVTDTVGSSAHPGLFLEVGNHTDSNNLNSPLTIIRQLT